MPLNVRASLTAIASDDRNIQSIRDAAINKLFLEDTTNFFTIVPGIKGGQQVATLTGVEYITTSDPGCDNSGTTVSFPSLDQKWSPKVQDVSVKMCYTDFEASFLKWGLASGLDVRNLEESDLYSYIEETLIHAMKMDMQRIAFFGDEDIADQDILTDEAGMAKYYNTIEKGLIPTLQYLKAHGSFDDNFVTLSKNEGANDAANLVLAAGYASDIFAELTDVYEFTDGQILTNRRLQKNYEAELKGMGIQSSKEEIVNGISQLRYDGTSIVPYTLYDKYRKNDFKIFDDPDYITHLPHFALNCNKGSLMIGVDDSNSLTDLRLELPGGADDNVYFKAKYSMDFKMDASNFKAAI